MTSARGWDIDLGGIEVRRIQPYQAAKRYRCPGCHGDIAPRMGHYVIVPLDDPDGRRHWHYACWEFRERRRPGRVR